MLRDTCTVLATFDGSVDAVSVAQSEAMSLPAETLSSNIGGVERREALGKEELVGVNVQCSVECWAV